MKGNLVSGFTRCFYIQIIKCLNFQSFACEVQNLQIRALLRKLEISSQFTLQHFLKFAHLDFSQQSFFHPSSIPSCRYEAGNRKIFLKQQNKKSLWAAFGKWGFDKFWSLDWFHFHFLGNTKTVKFTPRKLLCCSIFIILESFSEINPLFHHFAVAS